MLSRVLLAIVCAMLLAKRANCRQALPSREDQPAGAPGGALGVRDRTEPPSTSPTASSSTVTSTITKNTRLDRRGIMDLPFLPVLFAKSASTLFHESECGAQARRFLDELENGTLWAARMYDSSTKFPDGVLFGNMVHYGNFDECYEGGTEDIGTRYCLIDIEYISREDSLPNHSISYVDVHPNASVWEFLRIKEITGATRRSELRLALCAPVACTPKDIEEALKENVEELELLGIPNTDVRVSVNHRTCRSRTELPEPTLTATIFWIVALALCVLIGTSSWYDYKMRPEGREGKGLAEDVLLCFSARRNIGSLFRSKSSDPLIVLDSLRVLLTLCVVFGHRYFQQFMAAPINGDYLETLTHGWAAPFAVNGTVITDVFLSISAALATKSWLEMLNKGKRPRFLDAIVKRYIRLTPSYAFVICIYAFVLPRIGTGTMWGELVERECDYCRDNWWTNLLYINNYVRTKGLCMFQSWYLGVDFQAYCITYFVVLAFWRLPRTLGYSFLALLTLVAASVAALITYIERVPPTFFVLTTFKDVRDQPYFVQYYVKTHMRVGACFVGMIVGAILYDLRSANVRLPKISSRLIFILTTTVLLPAVHICGRRYYDLDDVSPLETALYAGSHRILYAAGASAAYIFLAFGDGMEGLRNFLSPTWMQPLSKITYGAYLVHYISQVYDTGVARTPKTLSTYTMTVDLLCDVCFCTVVSTLLFIAVEMPAKQLQSLYSRKTTTGKKME